MSAIFISYSGHDKAWAERIRDWLRDEPEQRPQEQRFRALFLDFDPEAGLHPGERWRDQLYDHLQLCAAVIVIRSEAYATSQWCLAELGVAMASGKLVLPVRTEISGPLPKLLSETQTIALPVIDLEDGAAAGWQRLLRGLAPLSWQSRLPWPPADHRGTSPERELEQAYYNCLLRFRPRHARRPLWRGSLSNRARIGSIANASAPLSAAAIPPNAPCGGPALAPPASGP